MTKTYHSGMVKKSVLIKASRDKVWRTVSNIAGLPEWLIQVKKTVYLSKKKRGQNDVLGNVSGHCRMFVIVLF